MKKKRPRKATPEEERHEQVRQMLLQRIEHYDKKLGPWWKAQSG
jgi:hypothetical protein